ncbi:MAG: Glu/Leu/Phe/Val dehydrogenase dimerization domain-containing protein [Phycisphaeraceae bacterium]
MLQVKNIPIPGYEKVITGIDDSAGLHATIAIHSTLRGPALGGIRMFPYGSPDAALHDALRLSKAMSRKAAINELDVGGGKAVIMGDPRKDKTRALLRAMGRLIETAKGNYIGAEDAGISTGDMDVIAKSTSHVTGLSPERGGSGDPSQTTAQGVMLGMRAALRHKLHRDALPGVRVAIQGLGKVGWRLAELLARAGASLVVSDLDERKCRDAADRWGARIVPPQEIHAADADVLAPCAMGGALNAESIPQIRAAIVAGSANNQFDDETAGPASLHARDILHAPDYVINAGGLIRVYVREILKNHNLGPWLRRIDQTLGIIFERSDMTGDPPMRIADELARQRLVPPAETATIHHDEPCLGGAR